MDSYVVRIYRRDNKDRKQLVGLVEIISTQEQKPFRTVDELFGILQPAHAKAQKVKKERRRAS